MNLAIKTEYYRILNEVCELIPSMPWVVIEELPKHHGIATKDNRTGQVEVIRINSTLEAKMIIPVICHELAHCLYFDHSKEHAKLMKILIGVAKGKYSVSEVMNDVTVMANEYNRQQQIKKNNLANFFA